MQASEMASFAVIGLGLAAAVGAYYFSSKSSSASARTTANSSQVSSVYGSIDPSIYYINAALNGAQITDKIYTQHIADDEVIQEFYFRYDGLQHGFVICKTDRNSAFICHLIGIPGSLAIEIKITDWKPSKYPIGRSATTFKRLKQRIDVFVTGFGHYVLGLKDCRTFSKDIADFLRE